jgi:hypothetical protein
MCLSPGYMGKKAWLRKYHADKSEGVFVWLAISFSMRFWRKEFVIFRVWSRWTRSGSQPTVGDPSHLPEVRLGPSIAPKLHRDRRRTRYHNSHPTHSRNPPNARTDKVEEAAGETDSATSSAAPIPVVCELSFCSSDLMTCALVCFSAAHSFRTLLQGSGPLRGVHLPLCNIP